MGRQTRARIRFWSTRSEPGWEKDNPKSTPWSEPIKNLIIFNTYWVNWVSIGIVRIVVWVTTGSDWRIQSNWFETQTRTEPNRKSKMKYVHNILITHQWKLRTAIVQEKTEQFQSLWRLLPCPNEDWITNSFSCTMWKRMYNPTLLTTANEAGGSDSGNDSSWNEEANRERLEAAASAHLNGSERRQRGREGARL